MKILLAALLLAPHLSAIDGEQVRRNARAAEQRQREADDDKQRQEYEAKQRQKEADNELVSKLWTYRDRSSVDRYFPMALQEILNSPVYPHANDKATTTPPAVVVLEDDDGAASGFSVKDWFGNLTYYDVNGAKVGYVSSNNGGAKASYEIEELALAIVTPGAGTAVKAVGRGVYKGFLSGIGALAKVGQAARAGMTAALKGRTLRAAPEVVARAAEIMNLSVRGPAELTALQKALTEFAVSPRVIVSQAGERNGIKFIKYLDPEKNIALVATTEGRLVTVQGRSAAAAVVAKPVAASAARVSIEAGAALPGAESAIIEAERFSAYILNVNHAKGGHKARVFASALGYTPENAAGLIAQIRDGLATFRTAAKETVTQYGVSVPVDMTIVGPKGTALVRTGWFYPNGSNIPVLKTAYVKKLKK